MRESPDTSIRGTPKLRNDRKQRQPSPTLKKNRISSLSELIQMINKMCKREFFQMKYTDSYKNTKRTLTAVLRKTNPE